MKTLHGNLTAFAIGSLLGTAIILGRMTDPSVIIGALDVFGGQWDLRLFLMWSTAFFASAVGFRAARGFQPIFTERSALPCRRDLEPRLFVGSAIFGTGWGMAGLCPGPLLTGLATGLPHMMTFIVFVALGMGLHRITTKQEHSGSS